MNDKDALRAGGRWRLNPVAGWLACTSDADLRAVLEFEGWTTSPLKQDRTRERIPSNVGRSPDEGPLAYVAVQHHTITTDDEWPGATRSLYADIRVLAHHG